jgi:hypothetical protein
LWALSGINTGISDDHDPAVRQNVCLFGSSPRSTIRYTILCSSIYLAPPYKLFSLVLMALAGPDGPRMEPRLPYLDGMIIEGKVPFYRPGRGYQFARDELALVGRQDGPGKRKTVVTVEPLRIEKTAPKSKKKQDARYRKLLNLE